MRGQKDDVARRVAHGDVPLRDFPDDDCGVRVQYSVFECVLARGELRNLARRMRSCID